MPKLEPGDTLANGATVVAATQTHENEWVVLADWKHRDEYVTWVVDHNGYAYWGEYFERTQIGDAVQNYVERCVARGVHPEAVTP